MGQHQEFLEDNPDYAHGLPSVEEQIIQPPVPNNPLIGNLKRTVVYWNALAKRLGFDPREGLAYLVHCAGVSFRQDLLTEAKKHCTFDQSPPIKLEPEIDNPYDRRINRDDGTQIGGAVKVLLGIERDVLTSEYTSIQHVGFLPKMYCPNCACSLSGKQAIRLMCPKCDEENLMDIKEAVITRLLREESVSCGVDTITESESGNNRGLDIWVRLG